MRTPAVLFTLVAACSVGALSGARPSAGTFVSNDGVVTLDSGRVQGTQEVGTWAWRGIPYAAPPVGDLRWKPPAPPASWSDVLDGSQPGNQCLQTKQGQVIGNEDCLYLNVWAPAARPSASLPVIVFVHGGDWIGGAGSWALYDGAYLAEHGPAIVVTINYRLGALGFLAHEALAEEDPHGSTGNYGLLDQFAALAWVQRNAAAFGGDPTRVLLWGQSAGAWSTLMHLASPLGRDLFSRAFSESGGTFAQGLVSAEANGAAYAATLTDANGSPCSDAADVLACMRGVTDPSAIAIAPPQTAWDPVIDNYVLVDKVETTFMNGTEAHVPLIIGTGSVEYAGGLLKANPPITSVTSETRYDDAVMHLFPVRYNDVLAEYPAASFPSARAAYVAMLDDSAMLCPTRRTARAIVASPQAAPVWRYVYAHADSTGAYATYGASHAVDLPFWFHTFSAVLNFTPDQDELSMSDDLVGYLTRFAATGDPNAPTSPSWPAYDGSDPYITLDTTIGSGQGYHPVRCDFWDMFQSPP
jgi:para-nitrobenzyl esterase